MAESLPPDGAKLEETLIKDYDLERGEQISKRYSGEGLAADALYEQLKAEAASDAEISGVRLELRRGRGDITQTNVRVIAGGFPDPGTGGLQELSAIDVIRPWYMAPYFQTETTETIAKVRRLVEDGETTDPEGEVINTVETRAYELFYHMMRGESYYETAYILRRSFITTSNQVLKLASANINTVVPLPEINQGLQNLIDGLPQGEWLKRPVTVRFLGREGFEVQDEYLWAPQWSVVYGGTFTGLN